ncbi:phosphatase PAP2 family protein [Aquiflexum sp.]|uniref:phosphatase PAP2 family protein n=1 Tax=Aquiflexum sp. TaxID=1872584 RepID=UPI0035934503
MLEKIGHWDKQLFIFLNSFHSDVLDPVMFQLTQTLPWIPLYIFLAYLIWKIYGRDSWWVFIAIGLTILLADKTTSALMKPYFERLRPCQDPSLAGLIHNYGKCGGMFGFASSHAANSFGIATIMSLALSHRYFAIRWLFIWAIFFSYTRIYLGVHYPGDVFVGGLVGIFSGLIAFYLLKALDQKVNKNKNGK